MPRSKEDIQAQLAAYVDGDLDAATRAEIERHLASNPQHQALMVDLISLREMVRAIPKVAAPENMTEALQSQLERGALLDSAGDHSADPVLRISRWPQIIALAAILILAVGLGIMVFAILPHNTHTVALHPTTVGTEMAMGDYANVDKQKADDMVQRRLTTLPSAPPLPIASLAPETSASATTSPTDELKDGTLAIANARAGAPAVTASDLKTVQDRLLQSTPPTSKSPDVCMVVATPDAASASAVVMRYATENSLAYRSGDSLSRADKSAVAQSNDAAGIFDQAKAQERDALKKALANVGPANDLDRENLPNSEAKRFSADAATTLPAANLPQAAPGGFDKLAQNSTTQVADQLADQQRFGASGGAPGAPTAPRIGGAGEEQAQKDLEPGMGSAQAARSAAVKQQALAEADQADHSLRQPYLVVEMTPRQAQELSELLSREPGQSAKLLPLPGVAVAEASGAALPPSTAPTLREIGQTAGASSQPVAGDFGFQAQPAATQPIVEKEDMPLLLIGSTQPVVMTTQPIAPATQPAANGVEASIHVFVVFQPQTPAAPAAIAPRVNSTTEAAPTTEPAPDATTNPATQPAP